MRRLGRGLSGLALAILALLARPGAGHAETEVDLALVIAVDVSFSMDAEEQALQREGFIQAFRSREVQDAIRRGMIGRIAVTYFEWAGANDQRVVIPWTLMEGEKGAAAFSDELAAKPTRRASRTSISGAIDFAVKLHATGDFVTSRKVVDISGDGPNNQGRSVTAARDEAVQGGLTLNGLPIMLKQGGYYDIPDLDLYYRDCVIGGPGAFMVPARTREEFVSAIKTKVLMEVAERPVPGRALARFGGGFVIPAQAVTEAQATRGNCFAGEAQWRDRMGN